MKKQTLIEICKLYPKIKIPFLDEAQYYLDLQQLNDPKVKNIISMAEDCEVFVDTFDITKYKFKKSEEIINYFKENASVDKLNAVQINNVQGKNYPGSIGLYNPEKFYVSIDIVEANWTIFRQYADINEPHWVQFVTEKFEVHPFIANSKSFRQIIFGNLNPSRQAALQKRTMRELAELLETKDVNIKMVTTDEIVLEFDKKQNLNNFFGLETMMMYKLKQFKMEQITKHGDTFYIQTTFNENGTQNVSLKNVPGNRYFIHYKEQILNMPISDNDLLFEAAPKQLAKWIL